MNERSMSGTFSGSSLETSWRLPCDRAGRKREERRDLNFFFDREEEVNLNTRVAG